MEILLWILAAIVSIVVGIPAALILGIFALYLVFIIFYLIVIFIVGIACIPISLVSWINIHKNEEVEKDILN